MTYDPNLRRRERRKAASAIERRSCANPERRKRLEKRPDAWLRFYCPAAFPLPWGKVHRDMIQAAVRTIRSGAGMCVAAPRGTGKSTVLWGMALWALLSGACRFPVVCGWSLAASRRMLRKWLQALADNPGIAADYPEACGPFEESTHANRLQGMMWEDTDAPCGADVQMMHGALLLPDGLGALGAVSIGGNVRGLHATLPDGSTLRPDVLLLDDPQDKKTANSPTQIRTIVERIEADLFNMSGPDVRLAIMAAVTVIAEDDVAEHFLGHADFESIRVAQVTSWPACFSDRASGARKLWEEWNRERVEGLADHDGGKRARVIYRKHKAAMTEGMAVSWPERRDRKRKDPDALFSAMWDYYRLGEAAFLSERQNAPLRESTTVYTLTPAVVASRVHDGRDRCDVPAEARMVVAATDINLYGLHSAVLAFGNDHTAWLTWYGRHPEDGRMIAEPNTPEPQAKKKVYEALATHGARLAALPLTRRGQTVRIGFWLIDGGYMHDVVQRFVEGPGRTLGIPVAVARGYGGDRYRPTGRNVIGRPRENCHLTESTLGKFIAFHADAWREVSQRAWLGTPNGPGSLSLFEGRHSEFAEHITRERLLEKLAGKYGTVWRWSTQPGPHDWGDALTMAYVAAAWQGIGTMAAAGSARSRRRRKETRKAKTPLDPWSITP